MFCIYWTEDNVPKSEVVSDLKVVLLISEEKRKLGHRFISISSELDDNVTKMGVSSPSPEYDWKKRRR